MAPRDIEKGKAPSLPGFSIVVRTVLCGTTDCPLAPGLAVQLYLLQIFVLNFFGFRNFFGIFSFLEFFRLHVWRVPYGACIPLKYGDPIHRLNQQIKQSIPGTKLFAVNRPQPNLRKRWYRALVKTLNDLGNVQPAADSLSMDASLLLNCRAAAENGNCTQSKRCRVA